MFIMGISFNIVIYVLVNFLFHLAQANHVDTIFFSVFSDYAQLFNFHTENLNQNIIREIDNWKALKWDKNTNIEELERILKNTSECNFVLSTGPMIEATVIEKSNTWSRIGGFPARVVRMEVLPMKCEFSTQKTKNFYVRTVSGPTSQKIFILEDHDFFKHIPTRLHYPRLQVYKWLLDETEHSEVIIDDMDKLDFQDKQLNPSMLDKMADQISQKSDPIVSDLTSEKSVYITTNEQYIGSDKVGSQHTSEKSNPVISVNMKTNQEGRSDQVRSPYTNEKLNSITSDRSLGKLVSVRTDQVESHHTNITNQKNVLSHKIGSQHASIQSNPMTSVNIRTNQGDLSNLVRSHYTTEKLDPVTSNQSSGKSVIRIHQKDTLSDQVESHHANESSDRTSRRSVHSKTKQKSKKFDQDDLGDDWITVNPSPEKNIK